MYIKTAHFRFYEELNDFLRPKQRKTCFPYSFKGNVSIKDLIESLGVPHTEIDLILVNGNSVDFNYIVRDCDYISVFPVFEKFDISSVTHLRSKPLRTTKFIVDVNLGKLAKYLRMVGFDTSYSNCYSDPEIVKTSINEKRIILTRDKGILKYSNVTHGYWVREIYPKKQLFEVINYFQLSRKFDPFTRCLLCNTLLIPIEKRKILDKITDYTSKHYDDFKLCPICNKVFWKGSHYIQMQYLINKLLK